MSVAVRPVRPEDAADCAAAARVINQAFVDGDSWFKKPGTEIRLRRGGEDVAEVLRGGGSTFLVAEAPPPPREGAADGAGGGLVGLVGGVRVDWDDATKSGHFGMLGVPAAVGGKGVGSLLVQESLAFLRRKGMTKVSMPVVATRNQRLLDWYQQRHGFSPVGELTEFPVPSILREECVGKVLMQQMQRDL